MAVAQKDTKYFPQGVSKDLNACDNIERRKIQGSLTNLLKDKLMGCRIVLDTSEYEYVARKKNSITGERIGGLIVHSTGAIVDVFDCNTFKDFNYYLKTIRRLYPEITFLDYLGKNKVKFSDQIGVHDMVLSNKVTVNCITTWQPKFMKEHDKIALIVNNSSQLIKLFGTDTVNKISIDLERVRYQNKPRQDVIVALQGRELRIANLTKNRIIEGEKAEQAKLFNSLKC